MLLQCTGKWWRIRMLHQDGGGGGEKVEMYLSTPVADPGFSREGANSRGGSQTYYCAKFLPKICMKMKEVESAFYSPSFLQFRPVLCTTPRCHEIPG